MGYESLGIQGPRGASVGAAWGRQKGWFHTIIPISEVKGQKLQLQKARASGLPLAAWATCFGESSSKGLVHGSQQSPGLHLAAQVTVPPSNSLQALMLKQLHRGSYLSSPCCPQHLEQCEAEQVKVSWMSNSLLRVTLLNFSPVLLGAV